MPNPQPPTCFFAYPSKPPALSEVMESAIEQLNGTECVDAISWKHLAVTGRLVIREICRAIDERAIFASELTRLNPNVLFELGYAVARNKPVWIILDPSIPTAEADYKRVRMLTSVGYAKYNNSTDVVNAFLDDQPFEHLNKTLYQDVIEPVLMTTPRPPSLLYLKSAVNTEASGRLTRRLHKSVIPIVTDDPAEVSIQTLAWYAENVFNSRAVVAHLLDNERAALHPAQNAKYAFVSGLAFGLQKPLLMLAHAPYEPAFDYQDLLRVHLSAADSVSALEEWLAPLEEHHAHQQQRMVEHKKDLDAALALQRIHLGDHIAENEQRDLLDYFIVTAPYTEALHTEKSMIYVGRKGSGKTANLLKIADELRRDRRNHVCEVTPVDYELEGVYNLLTLAMPVAERGFMIQSLWKFLIYSQLAVSAYDDLRALPPYATYAPEETNFMQYIESIGQLIHPDFTIRMETAIRDLCSIGAEKQLGGQRVRISEALHGSVLAQLREHLGLLFHKKDKVVVLVDNLDKAWRVREDLPPVADFLFGLLSVSKAISEEFARSGPTWRSVNLPIIVFLRSDIFSYMMSQAREADKISATRMDWTDSRLLERVIEERFVSSLGGQIVPADVWSRLFAPAVRGVPTKDYIIQRIIPRPRDMIYICKASLAQAINRGHGRIEQEDILQAEEEYSEYAYSTLVAETKPELPQIENLLVEFAGCSEVLTRSQLEQLVARAGIPQVAVPHLVDLLAESIFLGLEVSQGQFEYLYDHSRSNINKALARRAAESNGVERFKVNPPFRTYLGI